MTRAGARPLIAAADCLPWRLRDAFRQEPVEGRCCRFCDRAIAAPVSARGKAVCCLYCGLDRGLVAPEEVAP